MDIRRSELLEARNKYYSRSDTMDESNNLEEVPENSSSAGEGSGGEQATTQQQQEQYQGPQESHDVIEILSGEESDDEIQITDVRQQSPANISQDVVETGSNWDGVVDIEDEDDVQIVDERPLLQPPPHVFMPWAEPHAEEEVAPRSPQRQAYVNQQQTQRTRNTRSRHQTLQSLHIDRNQHLGPNLFQIIGAAYRTHFPNDSAPFGTRDRHVQFHLRHHHHAHHPRLHEQLFQHMFVDEDDPDYVESDQIDNAIMNRIEQETEAAMDMRLLNENRYNKKTLDEKKQSADGASEGYTTTISPEKHLGCELCGTILGQGIPSDFKVDRRYNESFSKYVQSSQVPAPWFCQTQCTVTDIDLSKRIFAAKCGHVYCGRCVKNIGNKPKRSRSKEMSITNPHVYAPVKCPAPGCARRFTPKGFIEMYY